MFINSKLRYKFICKPHRPVPPPTHLSPLCCTVLTPPSPCIEYQCSLQHSARPLTPHEALGFPSTLLSEANSGRLQPPHPHPPPPLPTLVHFPPFPGLGQRNSQQERLMERCPGTRARRAGDGKHMWERTVQGAVESCSPSEHTLNVRTVPH